jgi:hypothetical protein
LQGKNNGSYSPIRTSLIASRNLQETAISLILMPLIKYILDIPYMVAITRALSRARKCSELNYLTPHGFWNITDFGAKCEKCETVNTITLEKGEL